MLSFWEITSFLELFEVLQAIIQFLGIVEVFK